MLLKNFMADELQVSKGSVKMPIKGMVEQYKERYEEMSKDSSRPFTHIVYRTTPGNRIIIHVKVPSRSLSKFYYDVLLELDPEPKAVTLGDCNIHFFSNSPSFVYTYAYVFYHLDPEGSGGKKSRTGMIIDTFTNKIPRDRLLMPGTEKKLSKEALTQQPSTRNPLGLPYLDGSIYTAIFYLQDVTTLPEILSARNYRTERQIYDSVAEFDHLMAERKRVEQKERNNARDKTKSNQEKVREVEKKTAAKNRAGLRIVKAIAPTKALKPRKSTATRAPKTTRK